MRARHGLSGFKFQTDNGEFNSKVCKDQIAVFGGKLIINCPYSPETMSIIERYRRTIGQMAPVMLLHCGMAEHFRKVATYMLSISVIEYLR